MRIGDDADPIERATLFTAQFLEILQNAKVVSIRLPVFTPNLNAFAERFVRTIKELCLDDKIIRRISLHFQKKARSSASRASAGS
jgi:predicted transcriptional regulator